MGYGTGDAIIGGAFTINNFIGVFAGLILCPLDMLGRHLGEREDRFATNCGGRGSCKTRIAVFSQDVGVNAFGAYFDPFA